MSLHYLNENTKFLNCTIPHNIETDTENDSAYSQLEFNSMYELLSPRDQRLFYYMLEVYCKNRDLND